MEVSFRCKRSGNVVKFTNENDIAGLRKHEGYEEVIDNALQKGEEAAPAKEVGKARQRNQTSIKMMI